MDKVDEVRSALMKTLDVEKVYLMYMDEANQVHWHLVPRYNEKGFDVFQHEPSELSNFSSSTTNSNQFSSYIKLHAGMGRINCRILRRMALGGEGEREEGNIGGESKRKL